MIGLEFLVSIAAWIFAITFSQAKPDKANVDRLQAHRIAVTR